MTLILAGTENGPVLLTYPSPTTLAALTSGGLGALPGDAVTADLAENEAARVAAATSMPRQRAVDNMVRAGHDAGFAAAWCDALIDGGKTSAEALEMIAIKAHPGRRAEIAALDGRRRPRSRMFRDAWRRQGDGIVVDLEAARTIFSRRLIEAKRVAAVSATEAAELAVLAGDTPDACLEALRALDLRAMGTEIMRAQSAAALMALWPADLVGPLPA